MIEKKNKNYIYKRQKVSAACDTEENRKAVSDFCKSIADDLMAILEARAAVVGKETAVKEMNDALNNYAAAMAIQQSPW